MPDLTGMRFGRLTALEPAPRVNANYRWLCACDCGTRLVITERRLVEGLVTSCGCDDAGDDRAGVIGAESPPTRRCHDCGRPTSNYRCPRCWYRLRSMGGYKDPSEAYDE